MAVKTKPTDRTGTISNGEFAKATGCSVSMASRLYNGRRLPGADLLAVISEVYGIPLADLHAARNQGPAFMGKILREQVFQCTTAK